MTAKSIETINNALGAAKTNLNTDYLVQVVMGNEASDLDSYGLIDRIRVSLVTRVFAWRGNSFTCHEHPSG